MKRQYLTTLAAIVGAIVMIGLSGCRKEEPVGKDAPPTLPASSEEGVTLLAARPFQSDIPFGVFVHKARQDPLELDGFMRAVDVGQTGPGQVIQIPQCHIWFVRPTEPSPDWKTIAAEVTRKNVPGLQAVGINDTDLSCLVSLEHLFYLSISGGSINDAGLEHIDNLKNLQMLILSNCDNLTDASLKHLENLENLNMLFLNCTHFTGSGLEYVAHLKNLKVLWADYNNSDTNLEYLKNMETLHTLILIEAKISDAGLGHLKSLKNIQRLVIESGYNITDAGLKHLEDLKNLQMLYLGNGQYTDAGVEDLKKALPKCKILGQ